MASIIKILFSSETIEECEVIDLKYTLEQNIDNIGQTAGEVKGGQISITLGTDGSNFRFGWAVDNHSKQAGKLKFIDATGQTAKTLSFTDAYCVSYEEDYVAFAPNKTGSVVSIKEGATEKIVLSCKEIKVEGESHVNTWLN